MINLTGIALLQNYFPDKEPNYRQHPLHIQQVVNLNLSTFEVKFWETIVGTFNASMSEIHQSREGVLIGNTTPDIFRHEKNLRYVHGGCTYPHQVTQLVLLVPHAQPFPDFFAYLQNGTWKLLFAYTFIVIVVSTLLLTVSGYLQTKKIVLFQILVDVINLLTNDNGAIRYGRLHAADVYVIVPLTFTGLIVVNGILSVFQSYLTVPIYERQINTIDDLFKSTVPILSDGRFWANRTIEILEDISKHGGWSDKVHRLDSALIREEVYKFNTSIAFVAPDEIAQFCLEAQKRFSLKAYHLITEILEKSLVAFEVNPQFPFIESINNIIFRLQSAGLSDKWYKHGEQFVLKNMTEKNRNLLFNTSNESVSGDFAVPSVVWYGWIGSVIVFVCEIIWKKVQPKLKVKPQVEKLKKHFRRGKTFGIDKVLIFCFWVSKCLKFFRKDRKR